MCDLKIRYTEFWDGYLPPHLPHFISDCCYFVCAWFIICHVRWLAISISDSSQQDLLPLSVYPIKSDWESSNQIAGRRWFWNPNICGTIFCQTAIICAADHRIQAQTSLLQILGIKPLTVYPLITVTALEPVLNNHASREVTPITYNQSGDESDSSLADKMGRRNHSIQWWMHLNLTLSSASACGYFMITCYFSFPYFYYLYLCGCVTCLNKLLCNQTCGSGHLY